MSLSLGQIVTLADSFLDNRYSMMLSLDHRFDFKGQSIAWGVMGDGEALVLVHGTPFSSQVWRRIAPALANKWQVFYFDLLGYGESEKREGQDVSLAVQNEIMYALFRHWGLRKPVVLAHDFGGATALRAYYLNDLAYSQLILVDPVALAPWGSPFVQHVRKFEEAFAKMPDYMHDALLKVYIQGSAFNELTADALDIYMRPWRGELGKSAFYRQIAQMDETYTDEISRYYGTMDCKIKLLWGQEDQWIPASQGKKLADMITGGQITVVPKSGHLMQEDHPEAILAACFEV
ncbi:alpha/beta fold hydrolase [Kiloniella litopenaei]|uniref:alpha/beta fold hydrolase n=1 Tax=Kiloniella litopenaei TaxID=1549748 RepID=UPI003BADA06E